jgi:hypothetical protein
MTETNDDGRQDDSRPAFATTETREKTTRATTTANTTAETTAHAHPRAADTTRNARWIRQRLCVLS